MQNAKIIPPVGGCIVLFDSRIEHEVLPSFAERHSPHSSSRRLLWLVPTNWRFHHIGMPLQHGSPASKTHEMKESRLGAPLEVGTPATLHMPRTIFGWVWAANDLVTRGYYAADKFMVCLFCRQRSITCARTTLCARAPAFTL